MTMDPAIARIARAFESARVRFAQAETFEDQEDEVSNMLHHLYRLVEHRGGVHSLGDPTSTHHAAALMFLRNKDTHETTAITEATDALSDAMTNLVGVLSWTIPENLRVDKRYDTTNASWLEGQPTIDTLLKAFTALA